MPDAERGGLPLGCKRRTRTPTRREVQISDRHSGAVLEFDCDTRDGMRNGNAIDGIIVTIEFVDGTLESGEAGAKTW